MKRHERRDALDPELRERPQHARRGGLARLVPDDQLGQQRVVERRHRPAGEDARVDAHARAARLLVARDRPGQRHEAEVRGLCVDAALDRVAAEDDVLLPERERLARGDADLLAHDVEPGDHLRDRVLDLQARVHLEEEVALAHEQALDGAGAAVADGARGLDGDRADALAQLRRDARARRLLDELLVPPLDRAVALAEVDDVAVRVREDLHLDVPRILEVLLDVDVGVREEALALARGPLERGRALLLRARHVKALAPAPAGGLERHRVADRARRRERVLRRGERLHRARHHGHARLLHQAPGGRLDAHALDRLGRRPDEHQTRARARAREAGVLGEEAVARVDGLRAASTRATSRIASASR